MRYIWMPLVIVLVFGLAAACGAATKPANGSDGTGSEFTRELSDGRTVTCLYYRGLSCDWENAR
jgi:hypothetical protein